MSEIEKSIPASKICPHCRKDLPLTAEYYHRSKSTPIGFHYLCKPCRGAYRSSLRLDNLERYRQKDRDYERRTRETRRARARQRWHSNPEVRAKGIAASKEWLKKNADRKREYSREWRKNNPDLVKRQLRRQYENESSTHKLRRYLSSRINDALNRQGMTKGGKSISELLEFTIDELQSHLEKQFTKKMNWENRGIYWEIDHIIPIAHFDIKRAGDDAFRQAWALTNLRPLPKVENRKKGRRRTLLV
jgi:hypothetical protein